MRLIDADALKDKVEEMRTKHGLCYAIRTTDISAAPTVDVAPVVRGKWIDKGVRNHPYWPLYCSACDNESVENFDYCPNCGAKMETDDEH